MKITLLDEDDFKLVQEAINEGGKIWENPKLDDIKSKIKTHFRTKLGERCCYCCKNTFGEFKMVLDIEHILPKKIFEDYMFDIQNLSVSCKRCNLNIKKNDISFIVDKKLIKDSPFISSNYKFIHPNLDDYFSHLEYLVLINNNKKIIKYNYITKKGKFTYKYFKLMELEIEAINNIQGIKTESLNDNFAPEVQIQINKLFEISKI